MKLMFLTLASLSSNAGHLARLSGELYDLAKLNEVSIVCLGKEPDDKKTKGKYKNISFFHFPVKLDGWKVVNVSKITKNINNLVNKIHPDLVILQMEVWDLMREFCNNLKGKTKFATVIHAMPFLGTPINPSGNFEKDVINYTTSGIEKFRSDYIMNHYKETLSVLNRINIIASNKTVAYYLTTYFKNLKYWTFNSMIAMKKKVTTITSGKPTYDFAYMARMEKGKGIEYLAEILKRISLLMSRQISVAIMGRPDDAISRQALNRLLLEGQESNYFKVNYYGWADENIKASILLKTGAFLYPSCYDTYAVVLHEALAFGLPSITWDAPFSRINYSLTEAVIRVPFLDFDKFAKSAVKMFQNRNDYISKALNFIDSFDSATRATGLDINIYKEIISHKND